VDKYTAIRHILQIGLTNNTQDIDTPVATM